MEKIITIDGKQVGFKATALTPRFYRHYIGRDMIADMNSLRKAYLGAQNTDKNMTEAQRQEAQISVMNLEIFENAAYIMARQYNPDLPSTAEEWLDSFSTFSIYEILPEILKMWEFNNQTTSIPKKK